MKCYVGGKMLTVARGVRARQLLAKALGANPYTVPAQAHHLFPVELFGTQIGKKLVEWGINLNGKENGVWLPAKDYLGRVAAIHRGRPLASYAEEVTRRFGRATNRDEALEILEELRSELLLGKLNINSAK